MWLILSTACVSDHPKFIIFALFFTGLGAVWIAAGHSGDSKNKEDGEASGNTIRIWGQGGPFDTNLAVKGHRQPNQIIDTRSMKKQLKNRGRKHQQLQTPSDQNIAAEDSTATRKSGTRRGGEKRSGDDEIGVTKGRWRGWGAMKNKVRAQEGDTTFLPCRVPFEEEEAAAAVQVN